MELSSQGPRNNRGKAAEWIDVLSIEDSCLNRQLKYPNSLTDPKASARKLSADQELSADREYQLIGQGNIASRCRKFMCQKNVVYFSYLITCSAR